MEHTYKVGGVRFGIRTNSEAFDDWLGYALADYRMKRWMPAEFSAWIGDCPQDKRGVKEFHILHRGITTMAKTLDLPSMVRTLLTEIESFQFPRRKDAIFAGAAVVGLKDARALVPTELAHFVGNLGGKVKRTGVRLPKDMFVAVEPSSGRLVPIPRTLKLPDDAFERLESIAPNGRKDPRIGVDSPTGVDVVLMFGSTPGTVIEPISRGATLQRLAGRVMNLNEVGSDALAGLGSLVEGARCYGVGGGGPEGMLQALTIALAS